VVRKIVLGTLGYAIATFILGATWHFVLFKDLYHQLGAYSRQEPIIALGFSSMLVQGVILSFLFQYFHRGVEPTKEGIQFALIMGAYMFTTTTLAFAAKSEVSSLAIWFTVQTGFHLIQFLITGVILGLVFGKKPA
jgi:hypothetical protein